MSNQESRRRVEQFFIDCLFQDVQNVGFDSDRLKKRKDEILKMMRDLPEEFLESVGGVMSFLNACIEKATCYYYTTREHDADQEGTYPFYFYDTV